MTYGAYRRVSISGVYTKGLRKRRHFYLKTGKRRDRLRNPGQVPGTRTLCTSSELIRRRVIRYRLMDLLAKPSQSHGRLIRFDERDVYGSTGFEYEYHKH